MPPYLDLIVMTGYTAVALFVRRFATRPDDRRQLVGAVVLGWVILLAVRLERLLRAGF